MKNKKILIFVSLLVIVSLFATYTLFAGKPLEDNSKENNLDRIIDNSSFNNIVEIDLNNINDDYLISKGGNYELSGNYNHLINIDCDDEVNLILNNVNIINLDGAAINVVKAEYVHIYATEESTNNIISGNEVSIDSYNESENSGAVIYSKEDLLISGSGILKVKGYINNGIGSADNLYIKGANIEIEAINHGIKANDSIKIVDSNINVLSGKDGIKSDSDEGLGDIEINNSNITINSYGDGISSTNDINIVNSVIDIETYGEAIIKNNNDDFIFGNRNMYGDMNRPDKGMNAEGRPNKGMNDGSFNQNGQQMPNDTFDPNMAEGTFDPNMAEGMPNGTFDPNGQGMMEGTFDPNEQMPDKMLGKDNMGRVDDVIPDGDLEAGATNKAQFDQENPQMPEEFINSSSNNSDISNKGIKATNTLNITNSDITINSIDDALHSNNAIYINGGNYELTTYDDALHGDNHLEINGGNILVISSNEGLEANNIIINDGTIDVNSSDDGFNASGSNSAYLEINGGEIHVNASGDGLDSNGSLLINGGLIIIDGPTSSGDGALDSNSSLLINGGTVLAVGSSGMDETFDEESKQPSFRLSVTNSNEKIEIYDSNNKLLFEYAPSKNYSSIVFSSKDLVLKETYKVVVGSNTYEVTLNSNSEGKTNSFKGGRF